MEINVLEHAKASTLDSVMSGLKLNLGNKLLEIIDSRSVVYSDYPLHGNTGDTFILAGALRFLKENSIGIVNYDNTYAKKLNEFRSAPRHVPILCHGGGNFGDLYPTHQNLREQLAGELTDRRIVIMPQSIHFSSDETMERSASVFRKHKDFHFCVRDTESYDIATRFTDKVYLVPDCAHMLWGQFPPVAGQGRLHFLREDIEGTGLAGNETVDWATISSPSFYKVQRFMQQTTKKLSRRPTSLMSKLAFAFWNIEVRRSINEAYSHFSPVEYVETDRLHGMLFSLLLQKKVIFHDNRVKKLSRYKGAWLEELSGSWVTEAPVQQN